MEKIKESYGIKKFLKLSWKFEITIQSDLEEAVENVEGIRLGQSVKGEIQLVNIKRQIGKCGGRTRI